MASMIDGVILLDKPEGISSQKAVTMVKHACHADKAGHTGTLDPLATGLLAVCLGEATKFSQDLFNADKTYITTVFFGVKTETGDAEGKVIARGNVNFNSENETEVDMQLNGLIPRFMGKIKQVPPMYSAIKKDGKPLYAYAREGEMFDLEAREVTISHLRWVSMTWPFAVLEIKCSKGTYIRSLVSDMGEALGCGAHLTALRRTQVGHLKIAQAQTHEAIEQQAKIMAVDSLIEHLPQLVLDEHMSLRIRNGQRILVSDLNQSEQNLEGQIVKIYYSEVNPQFFMGIVEVRQGVMHPKRLLATSRLDLVLQKVLSSNLVTDTSMKHDVNSLFH